MGRTKSINSNKKKQTGKRRYDCITTEVCLLAIQMRVRLIQAVINDRASAAAACREIGIKLTTGCLIVRNYLKEHRIFQKPSREGYQYQFVLPRIRTPPSQNRSRRQRYEARNRARSTEEPAIEENNQIPPEIKVENEQNEEIVILESNPSPPDWIFYNQGMTPTEYVWIAYPFYPAYWPSPTI